MFSNQIKDWKSELVSYREYQTGNYSISAINQHLSYEMRSQNATIKSGAAHVVEGIAKSNQEVAQRISDSTKLVCGSLEKGFESLISANLEGFSQISNDLSQVYSKLSDISEVLGWGFSQTIEQLKTANMLLGNISELLRIPDIQKERQYHIEQGLKFYQNTRSDSDFYGDSLENFNKAEQIEPTDYFVLQRLGLIHLFSIDHLSIEKALEYFLKSSKYSAGEMYDHSSRTTNILELRTSNKFADNLKSILDVKQTTAQTWLYVARCHYILENYPESANYAKKAFELCPNMLEAGFDLAKYYSRLNRISESIEILWSIVPKNKYILQKVVLDFDLMSHKEVETFIYEITSKAKLQVEALQTRINPKPKSTELNEGLLNIISTVEDHVNEQTYIGYQLGIELLTTQQSIELELLNQIKNEEFIFNPEIGLLKTSPVQAVEYINFSKDKIPKFKTYHKLVQDRYNLTQEIEVNCEKLKTLKRENEQNLGGFVIGAALTALGIFFLVLFLTGGGFLKLIWFIGLVISFYHGIIRMIGNYTQLKTKYENEERTIQEDRHRELQQIESRISKLIVAFEAMELEKLDDLL